MTRSIASLRRRAVRVPASNRAFTLIELLTVMAIILVLAGLILSIAGSVNYKASRSRAEVEIKQLEAGLESYKVDNGVYPVGPSITSTATPPPQTNTDKLNAQTDDDSSPSSTSGAKYTAAGVFLFQQLSGNTQLAASNPTTGFSKAYITFLPTQLSTLNATPTSATYIVDPFGMPYGYSTANQYATQWATSTVSTSGYNPTIDLWSTAGYGTGGKSYPADVTAANHYTLWVKNW